MKGRIQNVSPKAYHGTKYRSTLEARTAEVLSKLGIPFTYEGRKITLLEGFRCPYQEEKVRAITYTPDFETGNLMIECKGFETPEWRNKKKYLFKYLMENEPETVFCQIHNCRSELLKALDDHLENLGYCVSVTPKKKGETKDYPSVSEAMDELNISNKHIGAVLRSLTGDTEYVYGYNWKLKQTAQ